MYCCLKYYCSQDIQYLPLKGRHILFQQLRIMAPNSNVTWCQCVNQLTVTEITFHHILTTKLLFLPIEMPCLCTIFQHLLFWSRNKAHFNGTYISGAVMSCSRLWLFFLYVSHTSTLHIQKRWNFHPRINFQ